MPTAHEIAVWTNPRSLAKLITRSALPILPIAMHGTNTRYMSINTANKYHYARLRTNLSEKQRFSFAAFGLAVYLLAGHLRSIG
jgi:uncharacterized protein YfaA (DUF2138 family)